MATPRTPGQWYFLSPAGEWLSFDVYSTSILEEAHFMESKFVTINIASIHYTIDLVQKTQTNTSSGMQRPIKREIFLQTSESYRTFFSKYTDVVARTLIPKDKDCAICLVPLLKPADFDIHKTSNSPTYQLETICYLNKCYHMFHKVCIVALMDSNFHSKFNLTSISCPYCQTIYGVKTGDQPDTGTMDVSFEKSSLPGHDGYGTIVITYNFTEGDSLDGISYHADGFPRVCFVPDSPEGKTILELLRVAWIRRLIFTIGTSATTGRHNCVVWNNIHHKTEAQSNLSGHGYPDPNFLKNIKMELALEGVKE